MPSAVYYQPPSEYFDSTIHTFRCEECGKDKPADSKAEGYGCDICLPCDALIQARKTETCAMCRVPVDPEDSIKIDGLYYCMTPCAGHMMDSDEFLLWWAALAIVAVSALVGIGIALAVSRA